MRDARRLGSLAVALVLLASPAMAADDRPVGQVVRQLGKASVVRDAAAAPLTLGAAVFADDAIEAGPNARVEIRFGDGSVVVVGARARIEIADYVIEADGRISAVLRLVIGVIRATLTPDRDRSFIIRTDTAVASARSTDWLVDAGDGTTGVFVVEGSVAVAGSGGDTVLVQPGFGTDVAAGAAPTPPARWGQARIDRTLARVRLP